MRLIDAIALYKEFREEMKRHPIPKEPGLGRYRAVVWLEAAGCFMTMLSKAPTIEAEPVRHGEWRIFRDGCVLLAECPECGTVQSGIAAAQWDYCPMRGAKMNGAADDADALLDRR